MSAPDPVVADPTDDELYEQAVIAVGRLMIRRWPRDEQTALHRAGWLVDRAMEVGTQDMVLLVRDHHPDCQRLAAAVLATDPGHNGSPPSKGDLQAAAQVIDTLLRTVS